MTYATCKPNRIPLPMLLPALLTAVLFLSPGLHAAEAGYSTAHRSLTIDCDHRYISQRQASWLLDTGNFSQAYSRRAALRAEVARACAGGVAAVRLEGKQTRASVARLSRR